MKTEQLLAKGMLSELRIEEEKLSLIAEDELGNIHNSTSAIALLVVEDFADLNLHAIQSSLTRLKDAQDKIIAIRVRIQKIEKELYG